MIIYFFVLLLGLIIGSFLNCLIWRLHKNESILGRSYCPKCRRQIVWYDNIPLLSFLLLGGKCRQCGKKISWQYPAVELIVGLLFTLAFYYNFQFSIFNFQTNPNFQIPISNFLTLFRDWFIISILTIIFIYDLKWYLILDVVSLPASAIVLLLNVFVVYYSGQPLISLRDFLISGIIGAGFFLFQFLISRGKWIGGGDIRLGLFMGLALGWPHILTALFISYLLGSFVGLALIAVGKKQWSSKVPFGTFLSVGTIIVLFWGKEILNWYFNLF